MSSLNDFIFISKIGEGSYSSVHKVTNKQNGQEYALKRVKIGNLKEKEKENALNEVRILASIDHPNIISYKNTFFDEKSNSLCIIMEYASQGDLQKTIDSAQKKREYIPEKLIWKVLHSCLRGLQILHNLKILHRDIKSANIFICEDEIFKLGDLNVSKVAKRGLLYTQTGTPYYASPEVWRDEPYDSKSDIWSLGCIMYELCSLKYLTQQPPFRARDMEGLYSKVQKGTYDKIPKQYSEDLSKIIGMCLSVKAKYRPSAQDLLNTTIMKKHCEEYSKFEKEVRYSSTGSDMNQNLLATIRVPKNMKQIHSKLPKDKYDVKYVNRSVEFESKKKDDEYNILRSKYSSGSQIINQKMRNMLNQQSANRIEDITDISAPTTNKHYIHKSVHQYSSQNTNLRSNLPSINLRNQNKDRHIKESIQYEILRKRGQVKDIKDLQTANLVNQSYKDQLQLKEKQLMGDILSYQNQVNQNQQKYINPPKISKIDQNDIGIKKEKLLYYNGQQQGRQINRIDKYNNDFYKL